MKEDTAEAIQFYAWKMAIRNARSDGLYYMEKYMMQAGTTPASGIPSMNRAASSPELFLTPAIARTIAAQRTMTTGKKYFAEYFFIMMLEGSSPAVTAK